MGFSPMSANWPWVIGPDDDDGDGGGGGFGGGAEIFRVGGCE